MVNYAVPTDHRVKIKENEKRTKKAVEHEDEGDTDYNWHTWNSPKRFGKRAGGVGNKRASGDHLNYSIVVTG